MPDGSPICSYSLRFLNRGRRRIATPSDRIRAGVQKLPADSHSAVDSLESSLRNVFDAATDPDHHTKTRRESNVAERPAVTCLHLRAKKLIRWSPNHEVGLVVARPLICRLIHLGLGWNDTVSGVVLTVDLGGVACDLLEVVLRRCS